MKDITASLCFLVGLFIRGVLSYSTGAPTRACGDMTPQHGFSMNTSPAPYLVEVSKTQYRPNERIYVRIRACGNKRFKGFMIQPRSAMFPNRPAFLGAFLRVRGSRYECVRSGGVLTHSSSAEKQSMTLTWIAPPGAAGHVVFRVTFVESFTSYWVGINSPVVYDGISPDLSLMQAFSLQSTTDRVCLPARDNTTTTSTRPVTTTAATTTTTSTRAPMITTRAVTRPPIVRVPTTTEYYYPETTAIEPTTTTRATTTTTTTRRPTTTTTTTRRPSTTTRRTTTTTTTTPAPTTTTTTTTIQPTTTRDRATTEEYYYYFWDTTTIAAIPTEPPTFPPTTTTRATTTTTTQKPTTTTTFPTTTTTFPTTTTTLPPTTTTLPSTTTTLPTTTTTYPTTTTTTFPTTTTTDPPTTTTTESPTTTTTAATTTTMGWEYPTTTTTYLLPTTTRQPLTTMRNYPTEPATGYPTIGYYEPTTTTTTGQPMTRTYLTTPEAPTTIIYPTTTRAAQTTTDYYIPTTIRMFPRQPSTGNMPGFAETTATQYMPTTTTNGPTTSLNPTQNTTDNAYTPTQTVDYFRNANSNSNSNSNLNSNANPGTTFWPEFFDERTTQGSGVYPTTDGQYFETPSSQKPYVPTTYPPYIPTGFPFYPQNGLPLDPSSTTSNNPETNRGRNGNDLTVPPLETNSGRNGIDQTFPPLGTNGGRNGNDQTFPPLGTNSGRNGIHQTFPPLGTNGGRNGNDQTFPPLGTNSGRNGNDQTFPPLETNSGRNGIDQIFPPLGTNSGRNGNDQTFPPLGTNGGRNGNDQTFPPLGTNSGRNGVNDLTFPPDAYPMYPWGSTTTGPIFFDTETTTSASANRDIKTTSKTSNNPLIFETKTGSSVGNMSDFVLMPDVPTTPMTFVEGATILDETTPGVAAYLRPDPACGSTQGCFDDCKNGRCNFIISWKPEKEMTHFEIRTKPRINGPYWAAVGFSDDKMMGLDSVTECITDGQTVRLYQSYNLDYYRNMRLLTPQLGLLNGAGSEHNGIFRCSFTRQNYVAGEKDVFDLSKDWHMMFAEGPAVNDIKIPHRYDSVPPVTQERMDLQRYPPMHATHDYRLAHTENIRVVNVTTPPIPTMKRRISMDTECGSKKSCFQDCKGSSCQFIVSWVAARDHVTFNIRAVLNETRNQWIAIAFSDDKLMGNDSVVQCVADEENRIRVLHSYNSGHNNIIVDEAQAGLHNTSASFADGVFQCSFTRDRMVPENDQVFNLDQPWSIHFAHGKSKKGIMLPHNLAEKPHVSDDLVDFSRSAISLLSANDRFIKIHASLMIFAWILCAAIASVVGRYFQPYYWGEKLLGSKTWIKVHWLFVLLTCSAVIAGFAVIFVGVNGISELYQHPEAGFNGTHPIMGLVVTLLALLNPLLLCLRPSEDSQSRAFFNCLYWLVEIGAHVLAVVTIYAGFGLANHLAPSFFTWLIIGFTVYQILTLLLYTKTFLVTIYAGFGLANHLVPSFFTWLIIGFTVYQILTLLFMEALKSFDAKKTIEKKKLYLYEMQIRPWNQRKNTMAQYIDLTHTSKGLKQMVLAAHLILLSALTTVMIVLIVIKDL